MMAEMGHSFSHSLPMAPASRPDLPESKRRGERDGPGSAEELRVPLQGESDSQRETVAFVLLKVVFPCWF